MTVRIVAPINRPAGFSVLVALPPPMRHTPSATSFLPLESYRPATSRSVLSTIIVLNLTKSATFSGWATEKSLRGSTLAERILRSLFVEVWHGTNQKALMDRCSLGDFCNRCV
jgi:hypothetical protein